MKKIALTGVIGSGKTTAANYFKDLGVPVFIADDCAKDLMVNNHELKANLISLLGDEVYNDGKLNKEFISDHIFKNKNILNSVNSIIHPMVQNAFNFWFKEQDFKYVIYEAALIFENKSEYLFDKIICIKTPLDIIHKRISGRDNYSKDRANKILSFQLPQDIKCYKSDFCINNTSKEKLFQDIKKIHLSLI
tara:strand:- start:52 stop:627 length:576 start_codon:yes stop_codon:yes gene_type:complete